MPFNIFITTSVAIKDGIFPYTTRHPFTTPIKADIKITNMNATPSGNPFLQKILQKNDTIPIVDEIDISISPINITKNSPIAIIATNDA